MKKVLTILAVAVTSIIYAQENMGNYSMSYFEKENFEIQASTPKTSGDFSYYIDVHSRDSSVKNLSLSIDSDDSAAFKEVLNKAKTKLVAWSKTAKENKITTLDKRMDDVKFSSSIAFLYGSKWQFDFRVKYVFRAKIIENKMYLIIQNKSELVSSSNQFMKCDGFLLVFESAEEIDTLIKVLDDEKVQDYFAKKGSKENLFQ